MSTTVEELVRAIERNDEQAQGMLDRITSAARPGAVFGAPVVAGPYTVITASRIASGGGFGAGFGAGPAPRRARDATGADGATPAAPLGGGGGMGGGGGASGHPVALIAIGPEGVTIRPIVDTTAIVLAGITASIAALGAFVSLRGVRRPSFKPVRS